jgi:hypothetical protein
MDNNEFKLIDNKSWKVKVDQSKQSAKVVDSSGEEIQYEEFAKLLELLNNQFYDLSEEKYGHNKRHEPLDQFTKKRLNIEHYELFQDETKGEIRDIFEAYIDRFLILDNFSIFRGRKSYETGYNAVISVKEAKKLLPLIVKYIEENAEN